MKYKIVFIVLVYRNIDVLRDFFQSFNIKDSKIIVVNSFYDNVSLYECEAVSKQNGADFIAIPNNGYGFGNNVGTKYALEHYDFDFLILSNSDIIIKQFNGLDKYKDENYVIAPKTVMGTGKYQNPDTPWELKFIYPMLSYALNHKSSFVYTLCHICTRLNREIFRLYACICKKEKYKIFSAHGSFIIFTQRATQELYPFFDDEMFLYNEEWYLALKANKHKVPIYFIPSFEVLHLEGASSGSIEYSEQDKLSFNILNFKRKNDMIK